MSSEIKLSVSVRSDAGKGASRRLRREANLTPGIIYGGGKEAVMISMLHKDLVHESDSEAFFSSILTLDVDGTEESVVLQDMQRHPSKPLIMHVDFLRVDAKTEITMQVPLHFMNEETCHGVAVENGMISRNANEVEIRCLPGDLPEYIEIDLADMKIGDSISLSELKLPKGVESTVMSHGEEYDQLVVSIIEQKRMEEESDDAADAADADSGDDAADQGGDADADSGDEESKD